MDSGFGRILVAFDGSENSVRALRLACAFARRFGSSIFIAHVYSSPIYSYEGAGQMTVPTSSWFKPLEEAAKAKAKEVLDTGIGLAKKEGADPEGEVIESPSIVEAILEFSAKHQVDLMVTGTRGTTGFKRLVLGSVAGGLVNLSECPVLVVK